MVFILSWGSDSNQSCVVIFLHANHQWNTEDGISVQIAYNTQALN